VRETSRGDDVVGSNRDTRAGLKGRGFRVTPDAAELGARLLGGGVHAPWPRLDIVDAGDGVV
jgi:hypothetical protein